MTKNCQGTISRVSCESSCGAVCEQTVRGCLQSTFPLQRAQVNTPNSSLGTKKKGPPKSVGISKTDFSSFSMTL